jgi:hypothetical protein
VGPPVFKTGVSSDPAQAGSIPVRLRYQHFCFLVFAGLREDACLLARSLARFYPLQPFQRGKQVIRKRADATGDFLEVTDPTHSFPQFDSWPAAEYQSGLAGPLDPHTGQSFMWSQLADEAYKRLSRTISVPAGGATLSLWTSFNLELDFDYLIVEAHTVGQDDWTTLPDANGHTSSDLSTDEACTGGWSNPADAANVLHPILTHYQTFNPADGTCSSTGTTGSWNAANGSSSGWQQMDFDLSPYAGGQVEVSITALSDLGLPAVPRCLHRRRRRLHRRGQHVVRGRRRPAGRLDRPRRAPGPAGHRGRQPQRLDAPRRPRHQGGRSRRDRRYPLHGLWLRGHHRRLEPQPDHGPRHRLPPPLTTPSGGRDPTCRPPEAGGVCVASRDMTRLVVVATPRHMAETSTR